MNWSQQFDAYCERTDFSYWSEPFNALSNVAFVMGAAFMWQRVAGLAWGKILCVILGVIGVGSFLFHAHATQWASTADVVLIGVFILTYLYLVNWHILGWPWWVALVATLGLIPCAAGMVPILKDIPFVRISNFYWTVPILLLIYAAFMGRAHPKTARGFVIGAVLLGVTISIRSLDEDLCAHWPIGTHLAWHILNGVMLAWMIEVYRRHMVEARAKRG